MKIENLIADRMQDMSVNAIREILKVVSQPGMVSLAGGIPSPDSFPLDTIEMLCHEVIQNNVAFVPGKYFFADGHSGFETMRLNFTMADEATIERAIKTLAGIL